MQDSANYDRRPATSIAELDLHISYLQRDLSRVLQAVPNMATKEDIAKLEVRMSQFVTRDELASRLEEATRDAVPTFAKRVSEFVQSVARTGAAMAAAGAFVYAVVKWFERGGA